MFCHHCCKQCIVLLRQQVVLTGCQWWAQGDNAALMTEIDNTSEAYEAMQSSNTGLVRQLGERDARISQLMGEQLRHDQAIARAKADKELAETASRTALQHKQGLEKRVQELQVDLQVLIWLQLCLVETAAQAQYQ